MAKKKKDTKSKAFKLSIGPITYTCNNPRLKSSLAGVPKYRQIVDRMLQLHERYHPLQIRVRGSTEQDALNGVAAYVNQVEPDTIYISQDFASSVETAFLASTLLHETIHCLDYSTTVLHATRRGMTFPLPFQDTYQCRAILEQSPYLAKTEYVAHLFQIVFLEAVIKQYRYGGDHILFTYIKDIYAKLLFIQHFISSTRVFLNVEGQTLKYSGKLPLKVPGPKYGGWRDNNVDPGFFSSPDSFKAQKSLEEMLDKYRQASWMRW